MDQLAPLLMSRETFYRWAEQQPGQRYERIFGEVVGWTRERWRHNSLKGEIYRVLADAASGRDIQVGVDGMGVAAGDSDFVPDVIVHQGPPIPLDDMVVPNPVVIVEVLSPSTMRIDTTIKLEAYFSLPSVEYYLLFRADRRAVTHWRRGSETPLHLEIGPLLLAPPGLAIDLVAIYDRAGIA